MGRLEGIEAVLATKFQVLLPHLDERQRRLAIEAEALSLGHGGIRLAAAGVRQGTVSRGAAELESGQALLRRVRRPGGGRKKAVDLAGDYKKAGHEWRPAGQPVRVKTHDFPGQAEKAIPYGIYDMAANTGWVSIGTDHDTAAFAVASIRRWCQARGRHDYPHGRRLLITADGGDSNGYHTRGWKTQLADLTAETGLEITVCHLPPGTSKWNKIEHRLFSHITMNWRGRPLTSHEVMLQTITATTSRNGLTVHAELDSGSTPPASASATTRSPPCPSPAIASTATGTTPSTLSIRWPRRPPTARRTRPWRTDQLGSRGIRSRTRN